METPSSLSVDGESQLGCYAQRKEFYTQKPWSHVQKRKPTVAEYPTPGPNGMPMPYYIGKQVLNSAVIHRPAWSLHDRIEKKKRSYAASPASYSTRDLKVKGGKAQPPAFTMGIKPEVRPLQDLPGPASYEVDAAAVLAKAPAFTHRQRLTDHTKFKTPAPNEYTLPSILGHHHKPPAHVMGWRLQVKPPVITPGPGAYPHNSFYKTLRQAPQYSMKGRALETQKMGTPGPGSYCPEKVILNLRMAPRPSLGVKHSPFSGTWKPRIVGPTCS